jgi:Domain of unknown function (DUF4129)
VKLFLSYRSLLLILFVFAGSIAAAQDDATTKFIDSLKKPPANTIITREDPTVDTAAAVADENSDTTEEEMLVDTAIISRPREISADSIALIKKDKGFYYQAWLDSLLRAEQANMKITKAPPKLDLPDLGVFFTIFKIVLWLLAIAILSFVIYKLFLGKSALFLTNKKNIDAVIDIEEESTAGQYDNLIKKAAAEKNYRLAVRYLYLQALYNLSEKGYVVRATEKTNYQYINELRKRSAAFASLFSALTFKYEYIWYGEYPVSDSMYDSLQHSFREFNKETA